MSLLSTLLNTIRSYDSKLIDCTDYDLTQTLPFGNTSYISSNNFKIINASIDYILSSKRFHEPLFKMNSLISKSKFSRQLRFLYIIIIIAFFYLTFINPLSASNKELIAIENDDTI